MTGSGEYVQVVGVAVGILRDLYRSREDIREAELDEVAGMVRSMNRDVLDDERTDWLRRDLALILDHHWDTLTDRRNRGRFDEIVRGILR